MFAGWVDTEVRERLSWAVPPAAAEADERVRLFWACKRLLNGKNSVVRSIELLRNTVNFIKLSFLLLLRLNEAKLRLTPKFILLRKAQHSAQTARIQNIFRCVRNARLTSNRCVISACPGVRFRTPGAPGREIRSDYVGLAVDIAGQQLVGFGVTRELRSGFERQLVAGAIANIGQVAK